MQKLKQITDTYEQTTITQSYTGDEGHQFGNVNGDVNIHYEKQAAERIIDVLYGSNDKDGNASKEAEILSCDNGIDAKLLLSKRNLTNYCLINVLFEIPRLSEIYEVHYRFYDIDEKEINTFTNRFLSLFVSDNAKSVNPFLSVSFEETEKYRTILLGNECYLMINWAGQRKAGSLHTVWL